MENIQSLFDWTFQHQIDLVLSFDNEGGDIGILSLLHNFFENLLVDGHAIGRHDYGHFEPSLSI